MTTYLINAQKSLPDQKTQIHTIATDDKSLAIAISSYIHRAFDYEVTIIPQPILSPEEVFDLPAPETKSTHAPNHEPDWAPPRRTASGVDYHQCRTCGFRENITTTRTIDGRPMTFIPTTAESLYNLSLDEEADRSERANRLPKATLTMLRALYRQQEEQMQFLEDRRAARKPIRFTPQDGHNGAQD